MMFKKSEWFPHALTRKLICGFIRTIKFLGRFSFGWDWRIEQKVSFLFSNWVIFRVDTNFVKPQPYECGLYLNINHDHIWFPHKAETATWLRRMIVDSLTHNTSQSFTTTDTRQCEKGSRHRILQGLATDSNSPASLCWQALPQLIEHTRNGWLYVIIGDESWFYSESVHDLTWRTKDGNLPRTGKENEHIPEKQIHSFIRSLWLSCRHDSASLTCISWRVVHRSKLALTHSEVPHSVDGIQAGLLWIMIHSKDFTSGILGNHFIRGSEEGYCWWVWGWWSGTSQMLHKPLNIISGISCSCMSSPDSTGTLIL
jgi:hypothetical protein